MNSNPNYGMPANFAEEKLLMEAERAARKCGICLEYGHGWEECEKHEARIQSIPVPVRVPKVRKRKASNFWLWMFVLWMSLSFVAGILSDEVFRMVTK